LVGGQSKPRSCILNGSLVGSTFYQRFEQKSIKTGFARGLTVIQGESATASQISRRKATFLRVLVSADGLLIQAGWRLKRLKLPPNRAKQQLCAMLVIMLLTGLLVI
jgi:hypothetical protein